MSVFNTYESEFVIFRMDIFLHDNIRLHTASLVGLLNDYGLYVFEHPPPSLDLAPSDFHLFLELNNKLGGMSFGPTKKWKVSVASSF